MVLQPILLKCHSVTMDIFATSATAANHSSCFTPSILSYRASDFGSKAIGSLYAYSSVQRQTRVTVCEPICGAFFNNWLRLDILFWCNTNRARFRKSKFVIDAMT